MSDKGILIVGSANMDMVVYTERFPEPGETIFGKKFEMFPGGKGANQAVAAAKLGGETFFLGKMGRDEFCDIISAGMKKDGVILDHLLIDEEEATGNALITVDDSGENEIIVISGSNMKLNPYDITKKENVFKNVKVVLSQLEVPIQTVLESAKMTKNLGKIFILNPAPASELPKEIYPLVDFLTPNETELEILSGQKIDDDESLEAAGQVMLDFGVKNIIVTLGKNGSLLINKEGSKNFPAIKVDAVDSTAAGDAFNGALAFCLANDYEIEDAVNFASRTAALSVTKNGAQSSMPTLKEVKLLKD